MATGLLVATMGILLPSMAWAGSGGRRNTALGLTAGALYTWLNGGTNHAGRRNTALALTAGSVMAWHKYKQAHRNERRQARLAEYYRDRYYRDSRPVYFSDYRPYSRVSGYRRAYGRRRHGSAYRSAYRAGYLRGMRVCRVRHHHR